MRAAAVKVPTSEAEATRQRLQADGTLRADLKAAHAGGDVVFPVVDGAGHAEHDFEVKTVRPQSYQDLLPEADRASAPRAFDTLGDLVLVKVPDVWWPRRAQLGEALLAFHDGARAVFHDAGVKGEFRVRELVRIAGEGATATTVRENGLTLRIDPGRAYYSPRLAAERARVAAMVQPGERFVDLFGGTGPMAMLAARAGADVTTIDLNPVAIEFAQANAAANRLSIRAIRGDARDVAATLPPADRILMNLPHGARDFLDVAARLAAPGARIHYHEIMEDDSVDQAQADVVAALAAHGCTARVAAYRHVRAYSASASHYVFDLKVDT